MEELKKFFNAGTYSSFSHARSLIKTPLQSYFENITKENFKNISIGAITLGAVMFSLPHINSSLEKEQIGYDSKMAPYIKNAIKMDSEHQSYIKSVEANSVINNLSSEELSDARAEYESWVNAELGSERSMTLEQTQNDRTYRSRNTNQYNFSLNDLKKPTVENDVFYSDDFLNKSPSFKEIELIVKPYGVPAKLIHAIKLKESRNDPNAVSHKHAVGNFMFLEGTGRDFNLIQGKKDYRKNGYASADAAARYILWLNKRVNGQNSDIYNIDNIKFSLAAYNAGLSKVKKGIHKRIPNYTETKNYIDKILMLYTDKGYYVQKNDTIYSIAKEFGTTSSNIVRNNFLKDNNGLNYGDIIYIGKNESETITKNVKKGDSWYNIAKNAGLKYKDVISYNQMKANFREDGILKIGDIVYIPPVDSPTNKITAKNSSSNIQGKT
jgi:LysM repeat protein/soluble lytic murein transglycosylase-like protein